MMQKEFLGPGSLASLDTIIRDKSARRVLLVTGKNSYRLSGAEGRLKPILSGIDVTVFSDFSVNPKIEDVLKGIALLHARDFDLVVAIGGGSVMDMAKSINVLAHQPEEVPDYITGKKSLTDTGQPLVAIPTTSGSGSEATQFAVVYIDQVKYSLSHPYLLPNYAIIDPELVYDMSAHLTATSGMDALSQAVESYWSVRSTEESRTFAAKAIRMIPDALKASLRGDHHAKAQMMEAAHLAGKAINITTTTAPHALSYYLTSHFNIPHGHAVALTLGEMLVVNAQPEAGRLSPKLNGEEYHQRMAALFKLFGCDSAVECRDKWYALMEAVGLDPTLRRAGDVTKRDLQAIVDSVNMERLQNNPVQVSADDLFEVLSKVYDG